jgi:hypothetical protein
VNADGVNADGVNAGGLIARSVNADGVARGAGLRIGRQCVAPGTFQPPGLRLVLTAM